MRSRQLCSYSRTFQYFMELEGSLQCLQEPDQSSPYHPILSLLRFILILSSYLLLSIHSSLFPSGFARQNSVCIPLLLMHATYSVHHLLLDQIIVIMLGENYSYEVRHRAVFSDLLSFHPSLVQIFSSAPCSQMLSVHVPPLMSDTTFHTHTKPQAKL
jgi:uncharacterized membrane protein YwaF